MAGWKPAAAEAASVVWRALEPFTPGALGALVAQMIRPGLGLRQRFIQWTVSVVVFHFISLALAAVFHWPEAVADVIGFFVAFLAFEALHAWQKAAVEAGVDMIKGLPVVARQVLASWGRRPGTAPDPEPRNTEEQG